MSARTLQACEPDPIPGKYRQYMLDRLDVHYQRPTGRLAKRNASVRNQGLNGSTPVCSISADFNGDGVDDFAGIYRFRDDAGRRKRSNSWDLDLVIMYSVGDRIDHVIYPYAGRYTAGNEPIRTFLTLQDAGVIDLMPGQLKLTGPAIVSYLEGIPAVAYYWNGRRFLQRAFGVDD